jgi:hypothetical protein
MKRLLLFLKMRIHFPQNANIYPRFPLVNLISMQIITQIMAGCGITTGNWRMEVLEMNPQGASDNTPFPVESPPVENQW